MIDRKKVAYFSQPKGFYVLFLTEFWERFGFYAINSLIILYMIKHMSLDDKQAYTIFAAFSALLYITPLVGGYIADRILGYQKTMLVGTFLLTAGYAVLSYPTPHGFYLALSLLIIGMGMFKSMPYALLSRLYKQHGLVQDTGFTLYYLSINIGGLIPTVLGGWLVRYIGWYHTFSIAAFGMFFGIMTYMYGYKYLREYDKNIVVRAPFTIIKVVAINLVLFIASMVFLRYSALVSLVVYCIIALCISYLVWISRGMTRQQTSNMMKALILVFFGVVFNALYYQQPMSLTLFIDRNVVRHVFGMLIPSSSFWTLNPMWIIILGPILGVLYTRYKKIGEAMPMLIKVGIGTVFMGCGYLVICLGILFADRYAKISAWYIVGSYGLQSTAELLVNALGVGMVARLVPERIKGVMVGIWFLGASIGGLLAGRLADLTAISRDNHNPIYSLHVYFHSFLWFGLVSVLLGLLSCLVSPLFDRQADQGQNVEEVNLAGDLALDV